MAIDQSPTNYKIGQRISQFQPRNPLDDMDALLNVFNSKRHQDDTQDYDLSAHKQAAYPQTTFVTRMPAEYSCESPKAVTINLLEEMNHRASAHVGNGATGDKTERQRSQRKRWDIPTSNMKNRQNSLSDGNFNSN